MGFLVSLGMHLIQVFPFISKHPKSAWHVPLILTPKTPTLAYPIRRPKNKLL